MYSEIDIIEPFHTVESSSTLCGETSYNVDPDVNPELSPVAENEETVEGAASLSNRIQIEVDDGDDDDPFSKRRYGRLTIRETECIYLLSMNSLF